MTITLPQRDQGHTPLPQYGFGTCADFDTLVKTNHFLFRVYTPRERSPFFDDTDPFFVAPKFNERYTRSPLDISHGDFIRYAPTYDDVVKHMDWTLRSSSPFISTSFSFIWSIWEALRRHHHGVKKDIEIAVIDASAVSRRAVTTVELLRKSDPSQRRDQYWKWYRFSQESQSVLVYESIPGTAVLASIPLLSLLEKLPSYFLRPEVPDPMKDNALAPVAWNYAEKKQSYRQFCQDMSTRFLQLSPEARLQDTTAGSVRLALAFLRPWLHRCIFEDFQMATVTLCVLAFSIAQWPGQWWAQEHSEMLELIRGMVLSVAEEICAKHQGKVAAEVTLLQNVVSELKDVRELEQRRAAARASRLQDKITRLEVATERERGKVSVETGRLRSTITELEEAIKKYEIESASRETKKPTPSLTPLVIPSILKPTSMTISPSPFALAPLSGNLSSHPRIIPTPITPPTSPIQSTAPSFPFETSHLMDPLCPEPSGSPLRIDSAPPSPTILAPSSPAESLEGKKLPVVSSIEEEGLLIPPPIGQMDKGSSELLLSVEPLKPADVEPPSPVQEFLPLDDTSLPDYAHPVPMHSSTRGAGRPSTLAETTSCVVTGFLVGAFITLCLLSPQRRTLLTNLT